MLCRKSLRSSRPYCCVIYKPHNLCFFIDHHFDGLLRVNLHSFNGHQSATFKRKLGKKAFNSNLFNFKACSYCVSVDGLSSDCAKDAISCWHQTPKELLYCLSTIEFRKNVALKTRRCGILLKFSGIIS